MDNTMDYGADILTLVDDDGVEHQFEVADTMDYEGHQYMALVPVFDEAGELLVLELMDHDGEGYLEPIADEDLFNTIAHMFMERLEEEFDFVEE